MLNELFKCAIRYFIVAINNPDNAPTLLNSHDWMYSESVNVINLNWNYITISVMIRPTFAL